MSDKYESTGAHHDSPHKQPLSHKEMATMQAAASVHVNKWRASLKELATNRPFKIKPATNTLQHSRDSLQKYIVLAGGEMCTHTAAIGRAAPKPRGNKASL